MLDIGWSELVVIGVAALIFVGPKDLPRMFFALGKMTAKARGMAREFQRAMDDAAKTSGLDDIRKDINGVKTGITAATNPSALGINALEDAARKFEKWDPKSVLKPATPAAAAIVGAAGGSAASSAGASVATAAEPMGAETKALADKRAADAAAARAKAHELQAKAAASASANIAARAKADAETKAASDTKAGQSRDVAEEKPKPARAAKPKAAPAAPSGVEAEAKPARKPPVRRKKSEA